MGDVRETLVGLSWLRLVMMLVMIGPTLGIIRVLRSLQYSFKDRWRVTSYSF